MFSFFSTQPASSPTPPSSIPISPEAPTRSASITPSPAPPSSSSSSSSKKTIPVFLDPNEEKAFDSWREGLRHFTGMGLDETEKALAQDRSQWGKCDKRKNDAFLWDGHVKFLLKHLKLEGCPTTQASVHCAPCGNLAAGGFSPNHGILMCQNQIEDDVHFNNTLSHELIHMYDTCKFDVDYSNLRHHACTEIRAANLSGDCGYWQELSKGFYRFGNQQGKCVRRRAILSVEANPFCKSREDAIKAVDDVWASCKADIRPYDFVHKVLTSKN